MKVCFKCNVEKEESEFHKDKNKRDGLRHKCKECQKKYDKQHYLINKERKNKYHEEHKEKILKKQKQRYEQNREKILKYQKQYREEHKEESKKKRNIYYTNKRKNDTCYCLRKDISRTILSMLKSQNSYKDSSILECLPYTIQQLKEHIELQFDPWMNWENHGIYKNGGEKTWHIDHIIPHSLLPYDSMSHPNFIKCWSLSNLRPLEAIENIKKGNKMIEDSTC